MQPRTLAAYAALSRHNRQASRARVMGIALAAILLLVGWSALSTPTARAAVLGPDAAGYLARDSLEPGGPTYDYQDIRAFGTTVLAHCDDCVSSAIALPFSFGFYGTERTSLIASSNGFITFSGSTNNGCCTGILLPSVAAPPATIAGWWEDLYLDNALAIKVATLGVEPSRQFVIQWDARHYAGTTDVGFQIKLFEATDVIEVHYRSAPTDGGVHSAGIQNDLQDVGISYVHHSATTLTGRAVRYEPAPPPGLVLMPQRMPQGLATATAVGVGGVGYVFGGCLDAFCPTLTDKIVRYDPATGTVRTLNVTLPTPRDLMSGVWDGRTNVYLFGGRTAGGSTAEILRFNVTTETVTVLASALPTARSMTAAVFDGSDAYVFGGSGGADEIVRFTPSTGALTTLATPLPAARYGMSAAWSGTHAYLLGGYGPWYSAEIVRFTPATMNVTVTPHVLPAPRLNAAAVWAEGAVYHFGGDGVSSPSNETIRYIPGDGSVTVLSEALPSARTHPTAFWSGNAAYVIGGIAYPTWLDEIVRFVPTTLVDSLPPVTTIDIQGAIGQNGWRTEPPAISFTCADDLSGCATTSFRIDGGPWNVYGGSPITITSDGVVNIEFRSADDIGNVEATQMQVVRIDTTAPHVNATLSCDAGQNGWCRSAAVPLDVTVEDVGTVVYATDFSAAPGPEWSASARTTAPFGGEMFLGRFINQNVTLSLSGLPAHNDLAVEFDVYAIHSWDGWEDYFDVYVDGVRLMRTTFDNVPGRNQCYPADCASGPGSNQARAGAYALDRMGYDYYGAAEYRLSVRLPHDASSAVIAFHGRPNAGHPDDESWGIDNVRVLLDAAGVARAQPTCTLGGVATRCGVNVTAEGVRHFEARALDHAGNQGYANLTVRVDRTVPIPGASAPCPHALVNGWCRVESRTITTSPHETGSGILNRSCRVNSINVSCDAHTVGQGLYVLAYDATDVAGNYGWSNFPVMNDNVPPTLFIELACAAPGGDDWCAGPFTGYARAEDNTSHLAALPSCHVDGVPVACNAVTITEPGVHVFNISVSDNAGNVAYAEQTVHIDDTPPSASFYDWCSVGLTNGWCRASGAWVRTVPTELPVNGTPLRSYDFEAPPTDGAWSSTTTGTTPNGRETFLGPFGAANNLTFTANDLPPHQRLVAEFDVYTPRTWDGNSAVHGPDHFTVGLGGGSVVYTTTFSNTASNQCYPSQCPASFPPRAGALGVNQLGYFVNTFTAMDAAYRVSVAFDHADPTLTLWLAHNSSVAADSESWAIDNFRLYADVSGLAAVECAIDGVAGRCMRTVNGQGVISFISTVTDVAGNTGVATLNLSLDNTPPSTDFTSTCPTGFSSGWCRVDIHTVAMGTDLHSGLSTLDCALDGAIVPCGGFNTTTEGQHTVVATATDVAGNTNAATHGTWVDKTQPLVWLNLTCDLPGGAGWCRGAYSGTPTASDATSGVQTIVCRVNGVVQGSCALVLATAGAYLVNVTATDVAGNAAYATTTALVDSTAPTASIANDCRVPGGGGWCRTLNPWRAFVNESGTVAYSTGFDSAPGAEWSNTTRATSPGRAATAGETFLGQFGAQTVTLNLTGLSAHERLTVEADLYIIRTWDGLSTSGPDRFFLKVDDTTAINTTFTGGNYDYPHCWPSDCFANNPSTTGVYAIGTLGYTDGARPGDRIYRISATVPHNATSVSIAFIGQTTESITNEAWGLDNVRILQDVSGLPRLPATCTRNGVADSCIANVTTSGTDVITVTGQDLAGNNVTASITLRTDMEAPTVTFDPSFCTLPGNAGWCRDTLHLNWTVVDPVSGVAPTWGSTCTYAGNNMTAPDGSACRGIVSVAEGIQTLVVGTKDIAGNTAGVATSTFIDTVAPVVAVTQDCTTAQQNGWCRGARIVNLTASDVHSGSAGVTCTLNGAASPCTGVSVTGDGIHSFAWTATDVAGNVGTGNVPVRIDTTPPIVSGTAVCAGVESGPWCGGSWTTNVSATDATSGLATLACYLDNTPTTCNNGTISSEGTYSMRVEATDVAGHSFNGTRIFGVDLTAPLLGEPQSCTLGADDWCVSTRYSNVTSVDPLSGVASTACTLDGAAIACTNIVLEHDGVYMLQATTEDNVGNVRTGGGPLKVDKTPPSTSASLDGSTNDGSVFGSAVTITLHGTDATSGVRATSYAIDGGVWRAYGGPFIVDEPGTTTIAFRSADVAGNLESAKSTSFTIDETPPTTSLELSGPTNGNGWYRGQVTVTLSSSENGTTHYRIDGGATQSYTTSFSIRGDGTHVLEYWSVDSLGNAETPQHATLSIDTAPPRVDATTAGTPGSGGWTVGNLTVTLSATDAGSGVDRIEYRIDGGATQTYAGPIVVGAAGITALEFWATDVAGNVGTVGGSPRDFIAGWEHWCTVLVDGRVDCEGSNAYGEAADRDAGGVVGGAAGRYHTCFLLDSGNVDCQGYNPDGRANDYGGGNAVMVAAGWSHTCILTSAGNVSCWGGGAHGQLYGHSGGDAIAVGAGEAHTCILFTSGNVGCGGYGDGRADPYNGGDAVELAVGGFHTCARTAANNVVCWGPNWLGQAEDYLGGDVVHVKAGGYHNCIIDDRGNTRCWGQSGGFDGTRVTTGDVTALRANGHYTCALGTAAGIRCTGAVPDRWPDGRLAVYLDPAPPTTAHDVSATTGGDGTFVSNATITLAATDATSGVDATYYRIDGGAAQLYLEPFVVSKRGTTTVTFQSTDLAGNIETARSTTFTIDGTPPITSANVTGLLGGEGWYVGEATVTLSANENSTTYYRLDGGATQQYQEPFGVAGDGVHELTYWSVDVAGNVEALNALTLRIDTASPEVAIAPQCDWVFTGTWCRGNLTVTATANDATSGVGSLACRLGASVVVACANHAIISESLATFHATATDLAGNVARANRTLALDHTPPASSIQLACDDWDSHRTWCRGLSLGYSYDILETGSGIAEVTCTLDAEPSPCAFALTEQGKPTYRLVVVDNVGWKEDHRALALGLDYVAPATNHSLTGTAGPNGAYNTSVLLRLFPYDATSGVRTTWYEVNGVGSVYGGPVDISTEGNVEVRFRTMDIAENLEAWQWANFTIDTIAPTSTHSLSGIAGEAGWYVSNVTLTLNVSGDATATYVEVGGVVEAYVGPVTVAQPGETNIRFWSVDGAGNTEVPQNLTLSIDHNDPHLDIAAACDDEGDDGWCRAAAIAYSMNASDAAPGSGVAPGSPTCVVDDAAAACAGTVAGEGDHTLAVRASDIAGRASNATRALRIDSVAPESTIALAGALGNNGWYVGAVTVTIDGADATSGIRSIAYEHSGELSASALYDGPFLATSPGNHTVVATARDNAGNVEAEPSASSFRIDTIPPTCSVAFTGAGADAGWYATTGSIVIAGADEAPGSGVVALRYAINGGATQDYTAPVPLDAEGAHTVRCVVEDAAGNAANATQTIAIDTRAPLLDMTASCVGRLTASWCSGDGWDYAFNASDPSPGSGMRLGFPQCFDNGAAVPCDGRTTTEGVHLLEGGVLDVAGHAADANLTVRIDRTPPDLALDWTCATPLTNAWCNSVVTVSPSFVDTVSGIASVQCTFNTHARPCGASFQVPWQGNHSAYLNATDVAGNVANATAAFRVDAIAPRISFPAVDCARPGATGWCRATSFTFDFTGATNDSMSGLDGAPTCRVHGGAPGVCAGTVEGDGLHTIHLAQRDLAGNLAERTLTIGIDSRAPTLVSVAPARAGELALEWVAPDNGDFLVETGYAVYRAATTDGPFQLVATLGAETYFVDQGLPAARSYAYRVAATSEAGESPLSAALNATTLATPGEPRNPRANGAGANVNLTWFPPADDGGSPVTSYIIFRGTRQNATTWHAEVPATRTWFVEAFNQDGDEQTGSVYYRVAAANAAGTGARSNETRYAPTPVAPPPPPTEEAPRPPPQRPSAQTVSSAGDFDRAWDDRGSTSGIVERIVDSVVHPDGATVYHVGTASGVGGADYLVVAADAQTGAERWRARVDTGGYDIPSAITIDSFGRRVYVTGFGNGDALTRAFYASNGTVAWSQVYDGPAHYGDRGVAIEVDFAAETVYVAATSGGTDARTGRTSGDIVTLAYGAADGRSIWSRRVDIPTEEIVIGMAIQRDGDRIHVLATSSGDFLTATYLADGTLSWSARHDGGLVDRAAGIALSPDGRRVFVTGSSATQSAARDYTTLAYNATSGAVLWSASYDGRNLAGGPSRDDVPAGIVVAPDGNAVFVGGTSAAGPDTGANLSVVAYSAGGGLRLWRAHPLQGPHDEKARAIAISADGLRLYVAGDSWNSDSRATDAVLASLDVATGLTVWNDTYASDGDDVYLSVTVSPDARVYAGGYSGGPASGRFLATAYEPSLGAREDGGASGAAAPASPATDLLGAPDAVSDPRRILVPEVSFP